MDVRAFHVKGGSMWPVLRDGQAVVVHKVQPSPGDIVLYRRDGDLFIHRLLRKEDSEYIICGDTVMVTRHKVKEEDILGKVVSVPFWAQGRMGLLYGSVVRRFFRFLWLLK